MVKSSPELIRKDVNSALSKAVSVAAGASALYLGAAVAMPIIVRAKEKKIWQKIDLPTKDTIFDINFDPKRPEHGWLIGAKGTFLETFDAGQTWKPRTFNSLDEDEDITYRFEMASLLSDEGWIIGKPAIMLHTRDGGKQFERIPLSPKLPGDPVAIKATGKPHAKNLFVIECMRSNITLHCTVNYKRVYAMQFYCVFTVLCGKRP